MAIRKIGQEERERKRKKEREREKTYKQAAAKGSSKIRRTIKVRRHHQCSLILF